MKGLKLAESGLQQLQVPRGTAEPECRQEFEVREPRVVDGVPRQYWVDPADWAAGMETWWTPYRTAGISPIVVEPNLQSCHDTHCRNYVKLIL